MKTHWTLLLHFLFHVFFLCQRILHLLFHVSFSRPEIVVDSSDIQSYDENSESAHDLDFKLKPLCFALYLLVNVISSD